MTTICFEFSSKRQIPMKIAKFLAVCTCPKINEIGCVLTDVQLLSCKSIRVLLLVEDQNVDWILDLVDWARLYEDVCDEQAPIASSPIPDWVQTAFDLASLLNYLFGGIEPISHQLKSWLQTTFVSRVTLSPLRATALSERARSAIRELADVWKHVLPQLPPLPPTNPDADCGSPESVLKPILDEPPPENWSDLVSTSTWNVKRPRPTSSSPTSTQQLELPEAVKVNRVDQENLWRVAFLGVDDRFGVDNQFLSPERVWLTGPSPKELRMSLEGWA